MSIDLTWWQNKEEEIRRDFPENSSKVFKLLDEAWREAQKQPQQKRKKMSTKRSPSFDSIITENQLCKKWKLQLNNPNDPESRSRQVSSFIRQGLRYGEIGNMRFFLKGDIFEFFMKKVFKVTD